ncbi:hypothetical protein TNCV_3837561 [Trichonephila clavipes]|nr:hypothetical protein TNCV_3837561 [Trichonephila clavipes]
MEVSGPTLFPPTLLGRQDGEGASSGQDPRFTNGIAMLKSADNPSNAMNKSNDRLHGMRKMLRWCLNVFEKIVVKHLHKSLKIHTSR